MRDPNDAHVLGVSLRSFVSFWSFSLHGVCAFNCRIQVQEGRRIPRGPVAVLRYRTAKHKLDPTAGIDARRGFLVNSKYEARAM